MGLGAAGVSLGGVAGLLAGCEGASPEPGPGAGGKDGPRAKVVVWDMASRVQSPDLWNPIVPGMRDDNGFESALMEPLFILNYETGEIEPWLGESLVPNDTLDVWTLKIRPDVTWSDGEDFDANNVVFTISLLKDGPAELSNAGPMREWVKSVTRRDKLTVVFTLTKPNPRFQLDYFSVQIYGCVPILPEHIWRGKDPLTFKNYDPQQGWPVFTGPYKLPARARRSSSGTAIRSGGAPRPTSSRCRDPNASSSSSPRPRRSGSPGRPTTRSTCSTT